MAVYNATSGAMDALALHAGQVWDAARTHVRALWPQDTWNPFDELELYHGLAALAALALVITVIVLKCCRRLKEDERISSKVIAVKNFVAPGEGPRFRKRDKIAFMSNRVLRNAKEVGKYIRGGQGRKRRDMAKLVKKVFARGGVDDGAQLVRPDLPEEYLEEESDAVQAGVPAALVLVLKNLRVFGHFDNAMLLELVKNIEHVDLRTNDFLFRVGETDENMYIVESGCLKVYCDNSGEGVDKSLEIKCAHPGEPLVSLLSFLDCMGGKKKPYKTVSARAMQDTRVIKFSFNCFKSAFEKYPDSLARVVQVVMVRLQRVTFLALHQYMGLGTELMSQQHRGTQEQSSPPPPERQLSLDEPSTSAEGQDEIDLTNPMIFRSKRRIQMMKDDQLRELSVETFKRLLALTEEDLIDDEDFWQDIDLLSCDEGHVLVEEETMDNNCLILVLQGCVSVSQRSTDDVSREMHKAYPGGLLGQLQVLTSEPSFFTYRATSPSRVAVLSGLNVRKCMHKHPHVALQLALSVVDNLSHYVRSIDFALEWTLVESGKALYKQDAEADSVYVILSGRLRSVITRANGKREMVGEYGRGELTGIVETLMKTPRSTTVIAVRDTEVAKLPSGLIDYIKMRFPKVLMRLIKMLGEKLQRSWEKGPSLNMPMAQIQHSGQTNYSTVALIPLSPNVPVSAFSMELLNALNQIDPSMRLTKEYIESQVGADAFTKSQDFRLSAWLAHQEDKHRIVLYECDRDLSSWTKLCVRHADVIFILADPRGPSTVTPLEESLEMYARRTRKEMIFLHREDTKYPQGTTQWLKDRGWINAHHHIRCPKRLFAKKNPSSRHLGVPDIHSDFSRLARCVTGTVVGLVLGGGGARGCSHVGMIKAILEAGIPIDSVAGVSIGAFIGALWCQERDVTNLTVKARTFSMKMTQYWRQVLDLTYPYTSYFTGKGFNDLLEAAFEDRDIRDLWIPYFTVTTDITESAMRIHDYGSLWRYVRSSMSLAGYMPPLCDPHDGHLLLDGGYVNNLPADIMRLRGARHILAVDVGAQDDVEFTNYGDALSGTQVMWSRWNPFRSPMNVPNQADVQSRLAYVSCVGKLETVKAADYCDYIRPPIDRYGTLQFGSFDEIRDVGYYHGKTYFMGMMKAGLMRQFLTKQPSEKFFSLPSAIRRGSIDNISSSLDSHSGGGSGSAGSYGAPVRMSTSAGGGGGTNLNNLAEMVVGVRKPFRSQSTEEEEDEDSENLISDEEDDTESGFLSQI